MKWLTMKQIGMTIRMEMLRFRKEGKVVFQRARPAKTQKGEWII